MDTHAIALLGYMVSTVLRLIIALKVHVGRTENAVIQKAGLHAYVMSVGLVTTVHRLIFVLVHHADIKVYVKIILLTLPAFVTTVTLDINAKRLIFVSKIHAKIMEHAYHIQMVMSATACTCGPVRIVMKGTFVFWITLVIRTAIVPLFSLMLAALVYLVDWFILQYSRFLLQFTLWKSWSW